MEENYENVLAVWEPAIVCIIHDPFFKISDACSIIMFIFCTNVCKEYLWKVSDTVCFFFLLHLVLDTNMLKSE